MNAFALPRPTIFTIDKPATTHWDKAIPVTDDSWVYPALNSVDALGTLTAGWDGHGSPRISLEAIAEARQLVLRIDQESLPTPDVCPVPGGGIGLRWEVGKRELEFTVYPDRAITYLKIQSSPAGDEVADGTLGASVAEDLRYLGRWLAQP